MNKRFPSEVFLNVSPRPSFVREADFVHVALRTDFSLATRASTFSSTYFYSWRVFAMHHALALNVA